MARTVIKRSCKKRYTAAQLKKAIHYIQSGDLGVREASQIFKIPKSTLSSNAKKTVPFERNRNQLSTEEESLIVERLVILAEWGFPLTSKDLCIIVKNYLDSQGRIAARFIDNRPGAKFVRLFLERHPEIKLRTASSIQRSRAKVSQDEIENFLANLEKSSEGIVPDNIFNYDETNFTSDPGRTKGIFQKGVKYPEKIQEFSKSSTSVMLSGSASGVLLPPYVVYRSKNLYKDWCIGGIPGSVYNCSKSGWFDLEIFTDWFKRIFLPHARKSPGPKLLIGDNLRSHISIDVINLCRAHDIKFVCLPPNSTDKLQPLDVGFFGPLKRRWREVLRSSSESDVTFRVSKKNFPGLLAKALGQLDCGRLLPKAFEKSGIFPISKEKALEKIPTVEYAIERASHLDQAVLDHLGKIRYGGAPRAVCRPSGKIVPPGTSYTDNQKNLFFEIDDEIELTEMSA